MATRELMAIRRESGKLSLIAREDFDPAKHVLWKDQDDAMQGQEKGTQEVAPRKRGRPRRG